MTQLFIDGQEVVLPEQFELELITENPYFTRNGEYTYDIDIDLRVPQNRQIYKNIQRSDVTTKIDNRTAVITAGAFELIRGIEVVLSVDNYTAKIQIVAGNSQLNYNGEQRIREIEIDGVNYSDDEAVQSLYGTSKTHHAVYTPVVAYKTYYNNYVNGLDLRNNAPVFNHDTSMVPQYYLLYILENIIEKLGFVKGRDYIEDYFWQRVFIVNTRPELKPQEILPDWTVNEFFDEIEKYLHCIIVVDKFTGIYNIYKRSSYFDFSSIIYIDDVLDDNIEKVYDPDVDYAYNYDAVSYDFPSKDIYKYFRLDENVKPLSTIVNVNSSENVDPANYQTYYDNPYLIHSEKYGIDYAMVKLVNYDTTQQEYLTLRVVNRFADGGDKEIEDKTTFKIVPADIGRAEIWNYDGMSGTCPAVKSITDINQSEEKVGITDLINGNAKIESYIPDRIYIGIYYGMQKVTVMINGKYQLSNYDFPCSYVDHYFIDEYNPTQQVMPTHLNMNHTLSFSGDTGLMSFYKDDQKIDTSIEYSFKFITNKTYDLRQIFVIRNKKYFCKEIRYTITPKGLDKVAEGVFYLVE